MLHLCKKTPPKLIHFPIYVCAQIYMHQVIQLNGGLSPDLPYLSLHF